MDSIFHNHPESKSRLALGKIQTCIWGYWSLYFFEGILGANSLGTIFWIFQAWHFNIPLSFGWYCHEDLTNYRKLSIFSYLGREVCRSLTEPVSLVLGKRIFALVQPTLFEIGLKTVAEIILIALSLTTSRYQTAVDNFETNLREFSSKIGLGCSLTSPETAGSCLNWKCADQLWKSDRRCTSRYVRTTHLH